MGITFQNITIAAPSVLGEPDVLWGFEGYYTRNAAHDLEMTFSQNILANLKMLGGAIRDLVFENVVIGGEKIETQDHFYTNEFVFDLQFS